MNKVIGAVSLVAVVGVAVVLSAQMFDAEPPSSALIPHGAMSSTGDATASMHGVASTVTADAEMPGGHPEAIPSDTHLVNSGKVLEVIDSPMYTHLKVSTDTGTLWLAAYKMAVAKGDVVKYSSGITMPQFYSKSLDRTFDEIVFVDTLELVQK